MKSLFSEQRPQRSAFTLIELLVVISIIAVLAAMIFPLSRGLKNSRIKKVARAELMQMDTAIKNYKAKMGYYPPDNSKSAIGNASTNQLYLELSGAVLTNNYYSILNDSAGITLADLGTATGGGVAGIVNSSTSATGTDDKPAPVNFLKDSQLKPNQLAEWNVTGTINLKVLVCSVGWAGNPGTGPTGNNLAPWQYRSTNPVNNRDSFDLWVDVLIDGKTNRFSNWSRDPQIVP